MLTILGFVLTLGILIFVHEFGHYYIAKKSGVRIEEFSLGFGKTLWSRVDKSGTEWKISAIPLGGYVKMFGDSNAASFPENAPSITSKELDKTLFAKPLFTRFSIIIAGPVANYLLAILILSGFYLSYGKTVIPPIIDQVIKDTPAQRAGLHSDDRIIEAAGEKIDNFLELQQAIMLYPDQNIILKVIRKGEEIKINITPQARYLDDKNRSKIGFLGITPKGEIIQKKLDAFSSITSATYDAIHISKITLKALGQIITGKRSSSEIQGPLAIAAESGHSIRQGPLPYLLFIAMLSINLGLVNLLPIPILDGGHLVFIFYETITKKPPSIQLQKMFFKMGAFILLFLIVISTSNDIKSLLF